jgi:16S rRNA (guanine1516-N2)-methyltransferase
LGCHQQKKSFAVTTSHRPAKVNTDLGKHFAKNLGVPFAERNDLSLKTLADVLKVRGLVVVATNRVSYFEGGQEFFFHPGLASLRIKELKKWAGKLFPQIQPWFTGV